MDKEYLCAAKPGRIFTLRSELLIFLKLNLNSKAKDKVANLLPIILNRFSVASTPLMLRSECGIMDIFGA